MFDLYSDGVITLEEACMLESADISVSKALLALETQNKLDNLMYRTAEVKCMEESGNASSILDYYTEAEDKNNTEEKKKGLIASVWDAIRNMIDKIKSVFSKEQKIDPNAKVAVEKEDITKFEAIKKFMAKGLTIAGIIAGGAALIAIIKGGKNAALNYRDDYKSGKKDKPVVMLAGKVQEMKKTLLGFLDTIRAKLGLGNEKSEETEKAGGILQQIVQGIEGLGAKFTKVCNKVSKKNSSENGEDISGQDATAKTESADLYDNDFGEELMYGESAEFADLDELVAAL